MELLLLAIVALINYPSPTAFVSLGALALGSTLNLRGKRRELHRATGETTTPLETLVDFAPPFLAVFAIFGVVAFPVLETRVGQAALAIGVGGTLLVAALMLRHHRRAIWNRRSDRRLRLREVREQRKREAGRGAYTVMPPNPVQRGVAQNTTAPVQIVGRRP